MNLNKISSNVLGLILVTEFIMAQVIDGVMGVVFMWLTFLFWQIWYLMVLERIRIKAAEYYDGVVGRFKASVGLFLIVETVFSALSILNILLPNMLSATIMGVAVSARFLLLSVLFVWQISMLMNAFAATMSAEEYKTERGKIALMLVFAPIGALAMRNS